MKADIQELIPLAHTFFDRGKHRLNPFSLLRLKPEEIRAWAWGTGMGSDAFIYVIKNNGTLWCYDHDRYFPTRENFLQLQLALQEKKPGWVLYPCNYDNNLYIYERDKKWFEAFWQTMSRRLRSPYVCLEVIYRMVLGDAA